MEVCGGSGRSVEIVVMTVFWKRLEMVIMCDLQKDCVEKRGGIYHSIRSSQLLDLGITLRPVSPVHQQRWTPWHVAIPPANISLHVDGHLLYSVRHLPTIQMVPF